MSADAGSRRWIGLLLAPTVALAIGWAPLPLETAAHRLAAVFALVVVLWISEAIPLAVTALLGPALAVLLGIAGAQEAFAPFGNPVLFLFIGSFLLACAMRRHGLDRRIALFVLSRRWVGGSPPRILFAFGAIAALLSMWMSNTATTAMMLPLAIGVLGTLTGDLQHDRSTPPFATGLLLMIAFSCNVGGVATPVGSPPNLIAIGLIEQQLGRRISFLDWMAFGLPIAVVLFLLVFVLIRKLYPAPGELAGATRAVRAARATLGPWSPGERVALGAFGLAVALWVLPGLVTLAAPGAPFGIALSRALPEGPAALLAATLLFVIPVERRSWRPALSWDDARGIDWGTILLFGGGLSLGGLAFSTGLAEALGQALERTTGHLPTWALVLIAVFVANVATEFMSNTATANLLVPVFLAVAAGAGGPAMLPALGVAVGCSLAFCLPVATPPNAIVYGSGQVPLAQMIRTGVWLDLGCGLLAWAGLLLTAGVH